MKTMNDVVAIYPGSFDPLTNGHVDIIQRGSRFFDRIVIGDTAESGEVAALHGSRACEHRARGVPRVGPMSRWTPSTACSSIMLAVSGATVIVRGLRAVSDFEYELQMALMNRRLNPDVETVFMMPAEPYTYVSSRLVKEVVALGGTVHGLVPEVVEARLRDKRAAQHSVRA